MRRNVVGSIATVVVVGMALSVWAAKPKAKATPEDSFFYIYSDKGAQKNHYAPSGWMGDYGDLKINDASTDNCADGRTCTKWTYSAKGTQGANWAGVFYQYPPNNWGDKPGGYNLNGYKRFTVWLRGEKGGEVFTEMKIGGITGQYNDSGSAAFDGPVTLTKDWKKYTIELANADFSQIAGGFCWVTNRDSNPDGMAFYMDEARFEK